MRQSVIEVNGRRYMDTKSAAELWGLKMRTVASYCRAGQIPGAFTDTTGRWCVPVDAIKPLTELELRKILFLSLELSHHPEYEIDYDVIGVNPDALPKVYGYLRDTGYIRVFDTGIEGARLPYLIKLTNKGVDLCKALTAAEKKPSGKAQEALKEWAPVIAKIIRLFAA